MTNGNSYADWVTYARRLKLAELLQRKSFFLLGARGTGKSTLIRQQLLTRDDVAYYDLLDAREYGRLLRDPGVLAEETRGKSIIVIDEVQKLPSVLDEVHRLIELRGQRFLLTGSSARKLRRGGANLLAGRAWTQTMHPLTTREIPDFDLMTYLNRGGLPAVYPSDDYAEELRAYVDTYLREEIQAEALTRRIDHFARFLDAIALTNGEELRYENLSRDTGAGAKTIRNYVEVLRDTLLAVELPAFRKTTTRKAIAASKLYLFDIGVTNTLARRSVIEKKSELFGKAFEHFIILEVHHFLCYTRSQQPLAYWRSTSQFEVDCVLAPRLALEVKATEQVDARDLRSLRALAEEDLFERYAVVSLDAKKRVTNDGIEIWPWAMFLDALWAGEFLL